MQTEETIYYTVLDQPGYPVQFLLHGEIGIYGGGLDPEEAFDHPSEASQEFQAAYHDQGECEYLDEEDFREIASFDLNAITFHQDENLSDQTLWEVEL